MLLYPVEDIGQETKGRLNVAKEDCHEEVDQRMRRCRCWVDYVDINTLKSFKCGLGFRSGYISRNTAFIPI